MLSFVVGFSLGVGWTYIYYNKEIDKLKEQYEQNLNAVREVYDSLHTDDCGTDDISETEQKQPLHNEELMKHHRQVEDYTDYCNKINNENYISKEETEEQTKTLKRPYVITPDQFGELGDYTEHELTYYADGVLTDSEDKIIENVDDIIGNESLNTFGEYEIDAVYVRNEQLKSDYIILYDRSYYTEYPDYC